MPLQKIPFNAKPYSKNDYPDKYTADNAYNDELINGIMFQDGSLRKVPGYSLFFDLGIADIKIDGLFFSVRLGKLFVVSSGSLYSVIQNGTTTLISANVFVSGQPVYWADEGTYIFAVNGGNIVYTDGTTAFTVSDADAPGSPTHIAFIDGYLLLNVPDSTKIQFSDLLAPTSFNALSFFNAEGKPDKLQAIFAKDRQLYAFGTETIEVWYNDENTPFTRRNDAFYEFGTLAKHSIVLVRNLFFIFLDNHKDIVILDGNSPKIISDPIKHILVNLTGLRNAIATEIYINTTALYKIDFPDDNRSFVYDYKTDVWSEWAFWETGTGTYSIFKGQTFVNIPEWGFDLIGDNSDSKVYKIGFNYLDNNGDTLRLLRRTPIIDYGTRALKRSNSVTIKFRRGNGYTDSNFNALDTDAEPFVMVRWKDDNKVDFGNWRNFSLGKDGKEYQTITIKPMGMYRSRQFEIAITDPVPFILFDMEEDVEVLV